MTVRRPGSRWLVAATLAFGAVAVGLSGWGQRALGHAAGSNAAARPPFRRAWWYWHHPFRLSAGERAKLQAAQCDRLYVHAGNLVENGGALALTGRQRFETAAPCELYAVVRVHPSTHERLLGSGGVEAVAALLRRASLPEGVRGVQLDADIPTAQLPEYARFLTALRERLPRDWRLSITALPDWLRSRDYPQVCTAADEIAPQFYGNRWPTAGKPPPPLWETDGLLEQARRSAVGPAQVWVGLPSYGRCVVLGPKGRPIGVRHDVDPTRLLEEGDWSVRTSRTRETSPIADERQPSEDTLALHADRDAASGALAAQSGSMLWFQWPRVGALEQFGRAIEALREPRIAGVCFFRWPAPGEPLAVEPDLRPNRAEQDLAITVKPQGTQFLVTVTNRGIDAPLLPEGVRVEIAAPDVEMEDVAVIEHRFGDSPCSPLRADRVSLTRALLRPGARWDVCRLRDLEGPVPIRVSWRDNQGRLQFATTAAIGGDR